MDKRIGLIAGSGQFPFMFARAARENGYAVYAVAHLNETDEALAQCVSGIQWVHLGQLKKIIKFFSGKGVSQAVMAGAIKKTRMFRDVRPDLKTIAVMAGMRDTHDDRILRAFAGALEKEGIRIKASTFLLPELLAPEGCWTRRKPTRSEREDIKLGWRLAKEIGRLDIGQCVVVAGGSVLAVEAIDGTDATIKRGGALARGAAVVVTNSLRFVSRTRISGLTYPPLVCRRSRRWRLRACAYLSSRPAELLHLAVQRWSGRPMRRVSALWPGRMIFKPVADECLQRACKRV